MRERWHVECAPVGRVCAAGGARLFVAVSGVSVLLLALTSGSTYRRVW